MVYLGRALNHLGRLEEAEVAYKTAKYLLPRAKPGEKLVTRKNVERVLLANLFIFQNVR